MPPVKRARPTRRKATKLSLAAVMSSFKSLWQNPKKLRGGADVLRRRLAIASASATITTVGYLLLAGYPGLWWDALTTAAADKAGKVGFTLSEVYVYGRNNIESQRLLEQIQLKKGDSILKFSPDEIRDSIKQISWVKDVSVQRRLPDSIYISIEERVPIALWQHRQKHYLVDADGVIISDKNIQNYTHLPVVVGSDAPRHAPKLLTLLNQLPDFKKRVAAITWVGERRWNLLVDKTIEVKLPEKDPEGALKRLISVLANAKIDFNQVKSIDLRHATQVSLRMTNAGEIHLKEKGTVA
ncbi:MAG: cell division protein FtsQ/DivIB [Candidatus Paracaedibacteraceae bacterium]|nr:cell division protein FtsQ/DivIB [Candidatus Paracaedibacteraceae bacterium]